MRVTGSLFTFAEMSASIKDGTFKSQSGAVLLTTNECVTVDNATNTIKIIPITGSVSRYPAYHELRPSGSSGGGVTAYVSYTLTRYAGSTDSYAIIRQRSIADGTYTTLDVADVNGESNTFVVDPTAYHIYLTLYAMSDNSLDYNLYADYVLVESNSVYAYNSLNIGPYVLSAGSLYDFQLLAYGPV